MDKNQFARIPQPPETFLLGNMLTLNAETPVQDMIKLARELGPIYRMKFGNRVLLVVSGFNLVDELSDEKRFDKTIRGALGLVRRFGGDGLFTAKTQEPNWSKAHNILLPNFSQKAMEGYHPLMLDIAEQLVLKWQRLNPNEEIDVVRDMTNLTVDTIGLCGFGYRFNSFYHDAEHPFVRAMAESLTITMDELRDVPFEKLVQKNRQKQLEKDILAMNETVDEIIRERRASGADFSDKTDLLSCMLSGVDKKSGDRLDDLNIRYQIITFLIAGHETTSGLLSFALYFLMQNPDILQKACAEVDEVFGNDTQPTYAQVNQLKYITQILKETLRLYPTAPAYSIYPLEDTIIAGKYKIKKEHQLTLLLPMLHRDKAIWGENPEVFDPDRFTPEKEASRPVNAYKPFGNGQRACIGRQFALQEAALVVGMILQRFKLIDHTRYELKVKETLTMKPDGFKMRVKARESKVQSPKSKVFEAQSPKSKARSHEENPKSQIPNPKSHLTPLLVLFGSNMGTAEELARRIALDAEENGFAVKVKPLDDFADDLPKKGLLFITTSSYNGLPPDNAVKFCEALKTAQKSDDFSLLKYTVFGVGNRDWAATFQSVPRFIDARLGELGANRVCEIGEGDTREDFEGQFQKWFKPLRRQIGKELSLKFEIDEGSKQLYKLEIVPGGLRSPFVNTLNAKSMRIRANKELHLKDGENPSERSTRHLELELPADVAYSAGDHLAVIPQNHETLVKRVAARFGFVQNAFIRLGKNANRKTFLPVGEIISVYRLLTDYVELQDVATRRQIQTMADFTECPPEKMKLLGMIGEDEASSMKYLSEVLTKRKSVIDLLEEFAACELPFEVYLEMLPPLRPRYYSISSSPLVEEKMCSITVAVVEGEARSGKGIFEGVCSNYLRRQTEGTFVQAFVKDTKSSFRLPENPHTPIIMVGPGTGIAPFRGFLQERAALKNQGVPIGESLLFFGCRNPAQDFIYEAELHEFETTGITKLSTAFSRRENQPKCYVQNEIYTMRDEVWRLIEAGASIYVCGDAGKMAPDVRQTFGKIYREKTDANEIESENWLNQLTAENRYLADVWATN